MARTAMPQIKKTESTTAPAPRLMNAATAAAYLGRSPRWLREHVSSSDVPKHIRPGGGEPLWDRVELDKWIDSLHHGE